MAFEQRIASFLPRDLIRETELNTDSSIVVVDSPVGSRLRGVSLPRQSGGYRGMFCAPRNLTLQSLLFTVSITDDGSHPDDLGKYVVIGITLQRLAADATIDFIGAQPEVTQTIQTSATPGGVAVGSIPLSGAQMAGLTPGDLCLVRVRRSGDASIDQYPWRAILLGVDVSGRW